MATEAPVLGKFNIESAQCDGESFLWKKHDQVIVSQKVIAFEGVHSEEENSLCRFQEVYRMNEEVKGIFTTSQKNLLCWEMVAGKKASKANVTVESTPLKSLSIQAESKSRGAQLTIEGTELCQGVLILDLQFDFQ